ncbi:hypothetical protein CSE45_1653 [Citreicella sp. SE45]|nr:hypothetical protein CSE45_1653 [Citreicella sp. SE45]
MTCGPPCGAAGTPLLPDRHGRQESCHTGCGPSLAGNGPR